MNNALLYLRRYTLWGTAATVLMLALGALPFSAAFSKGALLGGAVSGALFWLKARHWQERAIVLTQGRDRAMLFSTLLRIAIYGAVLFKAHGWDPLHLHGFAGAAIGLLISPVVVRVVGYAGWDLERSAR